jgi:tRNA(fMet)-specific endonuclease VapC
MAILLMRKSYVIQQLQLKSPEELAVTIISYEEQLRGWLKFVHRASNHQQMILGYAKLNEALGDSQ